MYLYIFLYKYGVRNTDPGPEVVKFPLLTIIINCEGWRRKSGSFRLFYTFYMHHCIPGIRCLTCPCPCPCPFRCPCPNAREQLPGSGFWARVRVRVKGLSGLRGGCYASAPSSGQFPMHIECLWDADHAWSARTCGRIPSLCPFDNRN